jgi:MFS family permease
MAALRAFIGGLLGLVIGAFGAGTLSDIIMEWAGVSNFEGGRGMAAVFVWAPLGAIIGLCLGIWLGLRWGRKKRLRAHAAAHAAAQEAAGAPATPAVAGAPAAVQAPPPPLKEHGWRNAFIAIGGIIGLGALIFWIEYASTPQHLEYDGAGADLVFELRMPAALAAGLDIAAVDVTLDTDQNQMPASWSDPPQRVEGDWTIYAGAVEMYFRTAQRLLVFRLPNGRDLIFDPDMGAKPDPDDGWSEWAGVNFIGEKDAPQALKPKPEDQYELRYRVRVFGTE